MRRALAIGLTCAALAAIPLWAGEGRIPIYEPTVISQPGHYILTRDISVASGDVITIQQGGVTLDLNGKTISISGSQGRGVFIDLSGGTAESGVSILNGRTVGGTHGISLAGSGGPGPSLPTLEIDGVEVRDTSSAGLHAVGECDVSISRCFVADTGGEGIRLTGSGVPAMARVVDCRIENTARDGIALTELGSAVVRGNVVRNFGTDGQAAAGVRVVPADEGPGVGILVRENIITKGGAQASGLVMDYIGPCTHPIVEGNVIENNGGHGISVDGGAGPHMRNNSVAGNGRDGIWVAGTYTFIEGNQIVGNQGAGINFRNGNGHAYRNNFLRNNGSPVAGTPNTDAGGNIE